MGKVEGIQKNSEGILEIGPDVSIDDLYLNDDCPTVIREVIGNAAVWQVRNETSVEKAVSAPSLLPELTLGLLAMDAQILLDDGGMILMKEYVKKSGKRGKMAALLLSEVRSAATARLGVSPSSEPIVAVAASVDIQDGIIRDVCVALTGAFSGRKWLAESLQDFNGMKVAEFNVAQVAAAVEKEVNPQGDYLGSVEYRRTMAGVLTRQALESCLKGAK